MLCFLCVGRLREVQIINSVFQSMFLWVSTKCQGLHPWFQEERQWNRQLLPSLINVFSEEVISKLIREYERGLSIPALNSYETRQMDKTIFRYWTAISEELKTWENTSIGAKATFTQLSLWRHFPHWPQENRVQTGSSSLYPIKMSV